MGFMFLGMISEACKKSFKANVEEITKMSVAGFASENPRVRFEAMQSTGLLLNDLAPTIQVKFHQDLVPQFVQMMNNEQHLKMQTQATACMTSLIRGFLEDFEEEEEGDADNKKLLLHYADQIVESIAALFEKAIKEKYQPLQDEVLVTLSCLASLMEDSFAAHYGKFMPGLKNILQNTKWDTQQEQELRSNCTESVGYILTSVKDKPEVCK